MTPEVAIVVSPRDWAERLHRFIADHGGARVRARVLDAREAVDERYQVLVAEDLTSFLTPRLVDELHRGGKRLLGVYDPIEPWGRERLRELGVDEAVPSDTDAETVLRTIEALAVSAAVDVDRLDAELSRGSGAPAPVGPEAGERAPGPRGVVIAVAAPAGGSGATEVALAFAQACGRRRATAALVDGDDVTPGLAQRLGLSLHPNLRTAVDVVEHWSGQLEDCLHALPGQPVDILCGLPVGRDAANVRPGEMLDVLRDLTTLRRHVVVNVGSRIEDVPGVGGAGHGRYELTRAVVGAADAVVAVSDATPVGLARLLDWLGEARSLARNPIHVAFNRTPSGSFRRGELEDELRRVYDPPSVAFLPFDKRVPAAVWNGEPVMRGGFARAVERLAAEVLEATFRNAREVAA